MNAAEDNSKFETVTKSFRRKAIEIVENQNEISRGHSGGILSIKRILYDILTE